MNINEGKPKGAPEWHDSDAPDAEGKFKELGIKDLAAWLIKTRKKDVKKISGSLTQQIVFNRKKDPEYAEKMEKVRKEVYKQLGRKDLLDERITSGVVTCNNCGWSWDIATGGNDPYDCHECGHKNNHLEESMKESRVMRFGEFLNESKAYYKGISKSTGAKKKAQMKKQADMDDDDPSAYKELPGDKKGKKLLKKSKHTKKYDELYGEGLDEVSKSSVSGTKAGWTHSLDHKKYILNKDVKGARIADYIDLVLPKGTEIWNLAGGVFANHPSLKQYSGGYAPNSRRWHSKYGVMITRNEDILNAIENNSKVLESVNEADDKEQKSTDRGPLDSAEIEKALKKKAEESGAPIGIIRAVMRRGMAAWKSGHRPGAGQEQWGYARVNSFLTGGEGTWGKADSDLAKEARDAGFKPKK